MEGRGGGEGNGPSEESLFVSISREMGEAYTWLKNKLTSLFKLFSESIKEALLGLKSFITSCCEKLREVLSWINTQLDDSPHQHGKRMVVVPEEPLLGEMKMGVPEKPSLSLLEEMKMLIQKLRFPLNQLLGSGISFQMKTTHLKLNGFLDFSEGFFELLEYAFEKPYLLILVIVDGFFAFLSSKRNPGRVTKAAVHKGKAAMAIETLLSIIISSDVLSKIKV